ncbi:hypothetical protein [Nitratireductor basaltis]|nr:hypothetical protein [Nitratireductor basaltis]
MNTDELHIVLRSAEKLIGSWWQDDRRNWCAYCGIAMRRRAGKNSPIPLNKSSRDHIIPRVHSSASPTIPCCVECNGVKGRSSMPDFLNSEYLKTKRKKKHKHKWPMAELWFVAGLASLKTSQSLLASSAKDPKTSLADI